MPYTKSPIPPRAGRVVVYTRPIEADEDDGKPIVPRGIRAHTVQLEEDHRLPAKRTHWFTSFSIGSIIVLSVYILLTAYVVPYFQNLYNQWHYGDSRIFQLDATINGRRDHFLAEVINARVIVIDLRNSDPSKALVFVSPEPAPSEKAQVTLQAADVNGDGKTDIVVHVDGVEVDAILYSVNDTFQWTVPERG